MAREAPVRTDRYDPELDIGAPFYGDPVLIDHARKSRAEVEAEQQVRDEAHVRGDLSPELVAEVQRRAAGVMQSPEEYNLGLVPNAVPRPPAISSVGTAPVGQGTVLKPIAGAGTVLQDPAAAYDMNLTGTRLPSEAPPQSSARAIRMPNGGLLFTNRPEYGQGGDSGKEIQMVEARKEIQDYDSGSPSSPVAQALIRRSAEQQAKRGGRPLTLPEASANRAELDDIRGGPTRLLPDGPDGRYGSSSASVSMIEGTPEQKMRLKEEEARGLLALDEIDAARTELQMTPQGRAELKTPQGVLMVQALNQARSTILKSKQRVDAVTKPGSPNYIADPKARAEAIKQIEDERDAELQMVRESVTRSQVY